MEVSGEDYNMSQLRAWLRKLNKPVSGNKATLILRINKIPVDERGECPMIGGVEDDNAGSDDYDSASDDVRNDGVLTKNNSELLESLEQIQAELVDMHKKYECLAAENVSLKQQMAEKQRCVPNNNSVVSYELLKEIMIEFSGESDVHTWITQFKNIKLTYNPDVNTMRALLVSKLKGKAQQWLKQMPNYAAEDPEEILQASRVNFSFGDSKLQQRQTFEERKWMPSETFAQYCNDKAILANSLNIHEGELVEYIVDGIPDNGYVTMPTSHVLRQNRNCCEPSRKSS